VLRDWPTIQRVTQLLNLTPQELFTRLEDEGQSLADVAQAQGVSLEAVVATILAPFKDTLQVRVNYGYLSQEEADFILWQRSRALEKRLSRPWRPRPRNTLPPESTMRMGPDDGTIMEHMADMLGPRGMMGGRGGMMGPGLRGILGGGIW